MLGSCYPAINNPKIPRNLWAEILAPIILTPEEIQLFQARASKNRDRQERGKSNREEAPNLPLA